MDYKHECSLDNGQRLRRKQYRFDVFNISSKNPNTKYFFRSVGSLEKEKLRHRSSKFSFVIHPLSLFRFYWEALYILILYVSIFAAAANFCNPIDYNQRRYLYEIILDYSCLLDVLVMFITGICIPSLGEVVTHPKLIARMNFKSIQFYIAFISDVPDTIVLHTIRAAFPPGIEKMSPVAFSLLPLLKILRSFRFFHYYDNTAECITNMYARMLIKYVLLYLLSAHCLTCVYIYISMFNFNFYPHMEITLDSFRGINIIGDTTLDLYIESLYIVLSYVFAINTLTSFRDTLSYDFIYWNDLLVFIVVSIIGFIFTCVFEVILLKIFIDISDSRRMYHSTIAQLQHYVAHRELPLNIKDRILTYYEYRFRKKFFQEKKILSVLSETLRRDIFLHSCRTLIETVTLLKDLPQEIISDVVSSLHYEVYLYNDVIVKAGTIGECMYFIANGTVAVSTPTGKEICHLQDGAYFGEISLIAQDHKRVATVVAIEICEIYRLDKKDFRLCFSRNSSHYKKIDQIATERMEKTILLEELHRKYIIDKSRHKHLS